ncbi:MAG: hypothetical protein H7Y10_03395 [Flavobacterium sp.]|nr:hypothetical protein [Flavobacterium sp.]
MGELFYLDFKSDSFGQVQIDEPIGYASIDFNLNQKDNKMARDVSFNGGETQFEFVDYRNHYLEQLLYYVHYFGFEAKVYLVIVINGVSNIMGELDFATSTTDDLKYFKCKVIQQSNLQIIKRARSIKVDLLSNKDIDGNPITPLVPENILLISKPVYQKSEWKSSFTGTDNNNYFNPCQSLIATGIEDSTIPLSVGAKDIKFYTSGVVIDEHFQLIKAKNALKNIKISLKGIEMDTTISNKLILVYGGTKVILKSVTKVQSFYGDIDYNIDSLDRNAMISIYFFREGFATCKLDNIIITAESTSYNSITPSFRLIDVMSQIVKSISGLTINAPRYAQLGQFYDNRLFNGNFLRNVKDKPFYVSLEDIEKSITEMNADYEIQADGKVFFGIEKDFYTGIESGFFDSMQFSEMNKSFNPKYSVKEFNYSYKNYQSLKEKEELNSADTIHGESRWVLFNKMVENKKEVSIEWTRDAFLIEATRRKAVEITAETASQEDNTLFAIDSINTIAEQKFTEVTSLKHTYNKDTNRLTLQNDGSVNFIVLGIEFGSVFTINPSHLNAGDYTVFAIANNTVELTRTSAGAIGIAGDGAKVTNYTYTLNLASIPYTNYTNQGFTAINNLNTSDRYSNLRYSVRRNIENYYQSYLATCNLYWKNKPIINTWYKNNGDCSTTYLGKTLVEKSNLTPINPLVTPFIYDNVIFANVEFEDFIALQNSIRSDRGYIRTIDNNDQVVKLYPVTMKYENLSKELTIKGEEKHEPITMTITKVKGVITINNQTQVHKISYEIKDEKVYIYDSNRQRLYNGCFWDLVSVNGATASTVTELDNWLSLL